MFNYLITQLAIINTAAKSAAINLNSDKIANYMFNYFQLLNYQLSFKLLADKNILSADIFDQHICASIIFLISTFAHQ